MDVGKKRGGGVELGEVTVWGCWGRCEEEEDITELKTERNVKGMKEKGKEKEKKERKRRNY